jgi:hypothetical protein
MLSVFWWNVGYIFHFLFLIETPTASEYLIFNCYLVLTVAALPGALVIWRTVYWILICQHGDAVESPFRLSHES